jgi:hypothetical protein
MTIFYYTATGNYLPVFDMNKQEAALSKKQIPEQIAKIAADINNRNR